MRGIMSIANRGRVARPVREPYDAEDLIGGKYRLSRKVGAGAMGSVWIATNLVLDSKVALKLLHPELRSPAVVERFLREARAAAMLNHPAIVRIFDLGGTAEGDPFIVMELLGGESLRACLDRVGTLPPERALQLHQPVLHAIHVAHEHGIVHRDLKPDNIMISEAYGGAVQLKVVDFGIAKLQWSEQCSTTGASLIGTPDYMSPEQARGLCVVDHRADIWSLGALLYEALAGRTPFARDGIASTLLALTSDPPPSLAGVGAVDQALWSILERGLRKDPQERWPTMRALGEALAGWLSARGVREDACGLSLHAQWLPAARAGLDSPAPVLARRTPAKARGAQRDAVVGLVFLAAAAVVVMALGGSFVAPRRALAPRSCCPWRPTIRARRTSTHPGAPTPVPRAAPRCRRAPSPPATHP